MRNVEFTLPKNVRDDHVEKAIDRAIMKSGLMITLRDSLKAFPGCIHWHIKYGRESGTLDITFWPQERRVWFSIQSGRAGTWIDEKMKLVEQAIQEHLNSEVKRKGSAKSP